MANLLLRRRVIMGQASRGGHLPEGYTRVEYVYAQGSSASYMVMGFRASEATSAYQIDMQVLSTSGKRCIIKQNSSVAGPAALYVDSSNELFFTCNGSQIPFQLTGFAMGTTRHIIGLDYYNHRVWGDEFSRTFEERGNGIMSSDAAMNRYLAGSTRLEANFYGAKVWNSGVLIRDYIFCRDSNNKPYAFDLVNSTISGFSGTDVVVGPDV